MGGIYASGVCSPLFALTTLKMVVVNNHDHCPGVCLDKWSSSDLPALHGDLHHVWRGEDWQACRLQQVNMYVGGAVAGYDGGGHGGDEHGGGDDGRDGDGQASD